MTATLELPILFPVCADAGPEIVNHPGRRMCESPRLTVMSGNGVSAEFCSRCRYRREPDVPQLVSFAPTRLVSRAENQPSDVRRALPCIHEGPVKVWCGEKDENRHLRECWSNVAMAGFDDCARNHPTPRHDTRNCSSCPHYAAYPAITTRHLLYHVYPVSGNGAWQWNVDKLCQRLELFNGRVIVAIVTDPPSGRKPDPNGPTGPKGLRHLAPCDPPAAVRDRFGVHAGRVEFIELENDPSLREVLTLAPMLDRLQGTGADEAVLYAQAKGVTYHHGHVSRRWAEAMYELYFDYWPLVESQLSGSPITGAFKKLGPGWSADQTHSDWHYSGSWFWFRAAELFRRDWRRIDQFWSGIEPYPSQHFEAAEAACLFHTEINARMRLYSPAYWQQTIGPALERWKRERADKRSAARA